MYDIKTCYFVGEAKSPGNNPIMKQYHTFFVGFVIDPNTHEILDAECTSILDITKQFVQNLFVGQSILDGERVAEEIRTRYFGSSQKALIVAFKQAQLKYKESLNI
ncbi:protein of unknown function [Salinibacillus kushneri]|uniref:DUF3870 domain-containing protein n=1 Tax=Salinibacillus kushneri TaxID=237682 RepID=A0A1I0JJ45_9BACI|nr:DUF3870 domain-containing protein [Salinibacillus kushneri]SEU10172.1 protein of unknown function [Salinibacillus kushneri]